MSSCFAFMQPAVNTCFVFQNDLLTSALSTFFACICAIGNRVSVVEAKAREGVPTLVNARRSWL